MSFLSVKDKLSLTNFQVHASIPGEAPRHIYLATETASYCFMPMYDKECGYVLGSEHQTLRQALTSIDVILQLPFGK